MFGYIKPHNQTLSRNSRIEYKRAYCALCHSLGKTYGFWARFMLSYDMVFMLLCLDAFSGDKKELCFRCPVNRKRKVCTALSLSALNYASFISFHLFCVKLSDNISDTKNYAAKTVYRVILSMCKRNKRYTQQLEQYEEAVQKLNGIISMIALTESGKITDPDDALDLFGKYTECLFDSYSFSEEIDESSRICMRSFSVNIGKWIYLMDAFDDYYSDRRASRFNLIDLFSESDQHRANDINKDILDKILYVHLILSDNIKNISENLCWAGHREIIDNIVRKGMDARFVYVLKKRYGRFTG